MSGEAFELGNDEVCVSSKIKDDTNAKGLDATKALTKHTLHTEYTDDPL